jgi:hypothetical protein
MNTQTTKKLEFKGVLIVTLSLIALISCVMSAGAKDFKKSKLVKSNIVYKGDTLLINQFNQVFTPKDTINVSKQYRNFLSNLNTKH